MPCAGKEGAPRPERSLLRTMGHSPFADYLTKLAETPWIRLTWNSKGLNVLG